MTVLYPSSILILISYGANLYNCSSNPSERAATLQNLQARLVDMDIVRVIQGPSRRFSHV